jgi:hypothetical protein
MTNMDDPRQVDPDQMGEPVFGPRRPFNPYIEESPEERVEENPLAASGSAF